MVQCAVLCSAVSASCECSMCMVHGACGASVRVQTRDDARDVGKRRRERHKMRVVVVWKRHRGRQIVRKRNEGRE